MGNKTENLELEPWEQFLKDNLTPLDYSITTGRKIDIPKDCNGPMSMANMIHWGCGCSNDHAEVKHEKDKS